MSLQKCSHGQKITRMRDSEVISPKVAAAAVAAPPSTIAAVIMAFVFNVSAEDIDVHNITLDEYLLSVRGPKHLPLNVVIPLTAIYVAIFVSGVVGNIAVCVVIIRNISLHTATNYYLFSLALSDLTLLLLGKCSYVCIFYSL